MIASTEVTSAGFGAIVAVEVALTIDCDISRDDGSTLDIISKATMLRFMMVSGARAGEIAIGPLVRRMRALFSCQVARGQPNADWLARLMREALDNPRGPR